MRTIADFADLNDFFAHFSEIQFSYIYKNIVTRIRNYTSSLVNLVAV